jgi:methionyl-tRNA formyltransferase
VSEQGLVRDADARIDWSASAIDIDRKIRGCDPSPGAIAEWNGQQVRLFGAALGDEASGRTPGSILAVDDGAVQIACGAGSVRVAKMRGDDGKKRSAAEFGLRQDDKLS